MWDIDFQSLSDLLKENKLDDIKNLVKSEKEKNSHDKLWYQWYWSTNDDVEHLIIAAISLSQFEIVRFFLIEGVSPNASISDGKTGKRFPLIKFAAESGNLSIVKLLVEYGANVNIHIQRREYNTDSAIIAAVRNKHVETVNYLLSKDANPNAEFYEDSSNAITLLEKAVENVDIPIVESLLNYGALIPDALYFAYEKFKAYKETISDIHYRYNQNCSNKIRDGLHELYGFLYYSLGSEIKILLNKLNNDLCNLDKINIETKNQIIKSLLDFSKNHSINLAKNKIEEKVDSIIKSLYEFDLKKRELENECQKIKNTYEHKVKTLLDYAFGIDLYEEAVWDYYENGDLLNFLEVIDITEFNFIGQSITREMLIKRNFKGAGTVLLSGDDLNKLKDISRREILTARLQKYLEKNGSLVPLWRAAAEGDIAILEVKLKAGVNPNNTNKRIPIVLAAENGHLSIVKMLAEHPKIDKETFLTAIEKARANKHTEIVSYLFGQIDINLTDKEGNTKLRRVIEKKEQESAIKELVKQRQNFIPNSSPDSKENMPIYKDNNPYTKFTNERSIEQNDNLLTIAELNITITEFNERYKGQYSVVKGEGIIWKGFWLVLNSNNTQCSVLMLDRNSNELKETPHSKGENNFINTIKQSSSNYYR